jgi:replicative DNA helicase
MVRQPSGKGQPRRAAQPPLSPHDALIIRRLVVGQDVNRELASVSTKLQPLVEYLASLAMKARQRALDACLAGRPDYEAWVRALAATDPDGPPVSNEPDQDRDEPPFSLDLTNSRTFFAEKYTVVWLINGLFVKDEPGVAGGPMKMLKTSILTDKVISLGTASPFLGKFAVPEPRRVALVSGESGRRTIQATANDILLARGLTVQDLGNVFWSFALPQLAKDEYLDVIRRTINQHKLEYIAFDPLYMMLMAREAGVDVSNMFDMGPLLDKIARACLEEGCTPDIAHHFPKRRDDPFAPPELPDLAYAGVGQYVRQWLLLAPRERFDPETGLFKLHLIYGGSAGHCGQYALDIERGKLDADADRRCWRVTVSGASEARTAQWNRQKTERQRQAEERKRDKEAEEDREDTKLVADLVKALKKAPGRQMTRREVREVVGVGDVRAGRILARAEQKGVVYRVESLTRTGKSRSPQVFLYRLSDNPEGVV